MAAMPAATSANCSVFSTKDTPAPPPAMPLEADTAYDVMLRLTPNSSGPKVSAVQ